MSMLLCCCWPRCLIYRGWVLGHSFYLVCDRFPSFVRSFFISFRISVSLRISFVCLNVSVDLAFRLVSASTVGPVWRGPRDLSLCCRLHPNNLLTETRIFCLVLCTFLLLRSALSGEGSGLWCLSVPMLVLVTIAALLRLCTGWTRSAVVALVLVVSAGCNWRYAAAARSSNHRDSRLRLVGSFLQSLSFFPIYST